MKATITNNGKALYSTPRVGEDDLVLAPGESGSGEFTDFVAELMNGAKFLDVKRSGSKAEPEPEPEVSDEEPAKRGPGRPPKADNKNDE